ncbi:MAG: hypothetical protein QUU85_04450 [Candidatus Eisenbacteria bacterium]|nr:hypothetical protein [Candidatus Eisenbacteria bacterium]
MRRGLPKLITAITGLFLAIQYFSPHKFSEKFFETALDWLIIIGIFSIILGIASLSKQHLSKIQRKEGGSFNSSVLLAGLVFMILAGFLGGTGEGSLFLQGYNGILNPVTSTMFALLAFYIASAAERAFRARTVIATILLVSAVIVMIGRVPAGEAMIPGIAKASDWLLNVPNMAAKRAIAIGLGLGGSATALKVVLGIEAPHLR